MTLLNEPQKAAVLHKSGPLLIFAGAGSGKTRTVTYRIAHLIAEHRVAPYRILAVTFTNKAAQEMRHRLESIVGEEIARDLWLGTFHGISAKLLRRFPEEVGLGRNFVIYDDSDQKALVGRALKALDLDDRRYPPKQVLAMISAQKREGKDPMDTPLGGGNDSDLDEVGRQYQTLLKRAGAVDFDDLLLHILRIVENPASVAGRELRRKFEHVLVDEFQDTNWVQYRIVRALSAETRNLCVVGDDDQSIYRWRGADVRIIRGFRTDFPETTVVKLEQNYRSTGNIVRAALGVISKAQDREPKDLWTGAPAGDPVKVRGVTDERAEAALVAEGLAQGQRSGVSAKEQAVFYRTHAQSRVLEEALRGSRIPYQIIGGMRFFERAEIKDLLSYLRLIQNPASDTDFVRVVNTPARGIGQKTIDRLLEIAHTQSQPLDGALTMALAEGSLGAAATKKLGAFADLMQNFRHSAQELLPSELLERVLSDTGYEKALRDADSAESDARLENLAELLGSLREYESEAPSTGEPATLSGYLERVALVAAVDTMTDTAMVSLMTVHSAKGLEFEQVWLTGMEEETFPYRGLSGEDPEELDEERRLAYVAITRARKQLTISYASSRFLFGRTRYLAPSRFLADLPSDAVHAEGGRKERMSRSDFEAIAMAPSDDSFAFRSGYAPFRRTPENPLSPGGRASTSSMTLNPGERFIERDEALDAGEDFGDSFDAAAEPVVIRVGQKARHSKFGAGIVERLESGLKPMVVVRFPGYGTRRIVADFLEFD